VTLATAIDQTTANRNNASSTARIGMITTTKTATTAERTTLTTSPVSLITPCNGQITFYRYTGGTCKDNNRAHIDTAEACFEAAKQYGMTSGFDKAITVDLTSKPKGCYFDPEVLNTKKRLSFNVGSDEDKVMIGNMGTGFCKCDLAVIVARIANSKDNTQENSAAVISTEFQIILALVAAAVVIIAVLIICRCCPCCCWFKKIKVQKEKKVVPESTSKGPATKTVRP